MEKDPPPAPSPAPKDRPRDPSDSAEGAQHREDTSEIGDRVGPDEEAAPEPDSSG